MSKIKRYSSHFWIKNHFYRSQQHFGNNLILIIKKKLLILLLLLLLLFLLAFRSKSHNMISQRFVTRSNSAINNDTYISASFSFFFFYARGIFHLKLYGVKKDHRTIITRVQRRKKKYLLYVSKKQKVLTFFVIVRL